MQQPSMGNSAFISVKGMSSPTGRRVPPPFEFLSNVFLCVYVA